ncbi:MAG: sulfatase-like hydrolase/transferase [Planctomycetes bacterium]|nr:sulfatase-like hydrolase/transferase [Planctomycetota bacterium]
MTRILLFFGLFGIASPWGLAAGPQVDRPNILLILADDVGREVLECYGGTSYATPQLDRLSEQGIRFTQAYAMAVCHPTRISLLTGQYPFHLGDPHWGTFPEFAESKTVAHVLKEAGYATAIAGKWQLTLLKDDLDHPHRLGFDSYCLFGWHEGPKYYQPHIWQDGKLRKDVHNRFGPDVYCDFLIDFMNRNQDRPFFAYYSMGLCHAVTNDLPKPPPLGPNGRYPSYAEMVVAMDERVGRLLEALNRSGLSESTLVLFVADNGTPQHIIETAVGDRLVYRPVVSKLGETDIPGGKGQPTDWGTRVPMIASWPGKIAPSQVNDTLVDVSDFLPTLASLAGSQLPNEWNLDGHSFVAALLGDSQADTAPSQQRQWIFAQRNRHAFVKDRRWKLYGDGRFFDTQEDPWEKHGMKPDRLSSAAATSRQRLEQAIQTLGLPVKYRKASNSKKN